jgi:catechol 2,3-dioxygenase-like lactoylglutathione lyase family enzyme
MKFHSTVVFVKDIEISKKFYAGFLGFSIMNDFGKNVILDNGLTLWEILDEHQINRKLKTHGNSNRFELYFESEDIEDQYQLLDKSGIKFLHKIHEEPWGQRTFRFFDPDRHLIEIGEPLEVFVFNMYKNGLSESQISVKSGIPLNTVSAFITKLNSPSADLMIP